MKGKKFTALALVCLLVAGLFTGNAEKAQAASGTGERAPFSGVIWIAGDSIASDHSDNANNGDPRPLVGWGEVFGEYLDGVTVHNEARSGRSTKSYVNENNNYKTIMRGIGAGDIFFIQFGHNDENSSTKLHTDPYGASTEEGSYKWYLATKYIDPALEAGAYPVLCTSVVRYLVTDGKLEEQTHAPYVKAMKELAAEYGAKGISIPVIDCHEYTKELYVLDIEAGASYHALIMDASTGEEKLDTTHYCEKGARNMALYIIGSCREMLTEITFSQDALTVYEGCTKKLPAPVYNPVYFLPMKNDSGVWESSNPAVVTVDAESGKLTGVSVGDAVITYTVGTVQGQFSVYVAEAPVLSKGDANGDGQITAEDALAVLKSVVGLEQEDYWPVPADCDGNSGITAEDALMILKHVVGIVDLSKEI